MRQNYLRKKRICCKSKTGFTLVELLITTAVLSVLVVVIGKLFTDNFKMYNINKMKLEMTDQSIAAYNHLTPEIRAAKQILACSVNSLTTYYLTGEATTPDKIIYTLDPNQHIITRSDIAPQGAAPNITYPDDSADTTTVGGSISNTTAKPLFRYFDDTGTELTAPCDPNSVRMVEINIRNQGDGNYKSAEIESKTRIELRNLKDNL